MGFISRCSESWGMGAEGFRRAPMMQQKLTTLTRTELNPEQSRRVKTERINRLRVASKS